MNHRRFVLLLISPVWLAAQCGPTNTSDPEENLLLPRQWMQLQSDEQGTGFNGVHTERAVLPRRKWTAGTGQVAFSSPVVDQNGTVWVGNVNGELVGIAPNGALHTRRYVGGAARMGP